MRIALYALVALLALWLAPPADAVIYPGQHRPAPIVAELVSHADVFWEQRGVRGDCPDSGPIIWQAPSLVDNDGDAWGRGDGLACELWLEDDLTETVLDGSSFEFSAQACQAIFHEDGHARGLPHEPEGLMAGTGPWGAPLPEPHPLAWAPHFCITWALDWYEQAMSGEGRGEWEIAGLVDEARRFAGLKPVKIDQWRRAHRRHARRRARS